MANSLWPLKLLSQGRGDSTDRRTRHRGRWRVAVEQTGEGCVCVCVPYYKEALCDELSTYIPARSALRPRSRLAAGSHGRAAPGGTQPD